MDMPYGYYQFVRFAALIGFSVLAYQAFLKGKQFEVFIYIVLAILFQPIFKIALGRQVWNIVDVTVGVGLLISYLFGHFLSFIKLRPKTQITKN